MSNVQKNYEAAFTSLQSSFGASGSAPCLPPYAVSKSKFKSRSSTSSSSESSRTSKGSSSSKDLLGGLRISTVFVRIRRFVLQRGQ
ncbi:hypothetical protein M422DRAFT_25002, partial [Sphaerobolus stellatus SS14]